MIALRLAFYALVLLAGTGALAYLILMARDRGGSKDA